LRGKFRATTLLGTLLALMTLASMLAMAEILGRFIREELRRQSEDSNALLAGSVAHEVSSFLEAHFMGLSLLAQPVFRDAGGPELLRSTYAAFEDVLVTDLRGVVRLASAGSGELGFDLSAREYFRAPLRDGRDYVSPSFIAEDDYAPSAVLSHPFDGGVAVAYINLLFMNEFMAGLPASETRSIAVVDATGAYLAHNVDPSLVSRSETVSLERWFRERGSGRGGRAIALRPNGTEELLCWASVPGSSGWTVTVSEPTARVFRALAYLQRLLLAVLAAYAVGSLALNATVIRYVRLDIERLVRFSQDLADGHLDAVIEFRGFYDLAHLSDNLARMGQAIREREARLRANERRLFDLLDFLPIPVILVRPDMGIELLNRAFTAVLGWVVSDIPTDGDWWLAAYPDPEYSREVQSFWNAYIATLREGREPESDFTGRIRCKDGSDRTMIGKAAFIADRFIITFVDITEADRAAGRMASSLREKEVLLKEIHHRVKNNLQLVISLLSLKASATPETEHVFDDSIDRIRVMAGIHELLYRSRDLSHIDLSEYIRTILNWLVPSLSPGDRPPALELELEPLELDIDKAIPCGLIINEVITNSLKYAFNDGAEEPRISLSAKRESGDEVVLALGDNGRGFPPGLAPERCESLGMQLIVSLCAQLGGTWSLDGSAGTRWTIRFRG